MIGAGDAVVCIDDSPCQCGTHLGCTAGSVYRVNSAWPHPWAKDLIMLGLDGVADIPGHTPGRPADRFRKVKPCDDSFKEMIKKLSPQRPRVKEDA